MTHESYMMEDGSKMVKSKQGGVSRSMSKSLLILLLVEVCLQQFQSARAEFRFDLGVELDYLNWDRVAFEGNGLMYGPRLNVGLGRMAMSARYLLGKFDVSELDDTARRRDWDFALSYRIHKQLTAFVTEKQLTYRLDYGDSSQEEKFLATGLGLGASIRIKNSNFFVTALVSYLPYVRCTQEIGYHDSITTDHDHTTGFNGDAGVGYAVVRIPITCTIGARYIRIEEFGTQASRTNTYMGSWIGLMFHL